MKWLHFGGVSIFFAFLGVLGVTTKRAKFPKNRVWGPVEAVLANFSGDLKVAHGDSATDEPKKSTFCAVEVELCRKYRFARAPAVGPMGARGQKDLGKKL